MADQGPSRVLKVTPSNVTTIFAGGNGAGFSGDGGPATAAQLSFCTGVAVDGAGNVYIADNGNNRVRMVSPTGVITTFAGNGSSATSGDNGPATLAGLQAYRVAAPATSAGAVYIAGNTNHNVRRVDTAGTITTVAGTGVAGFSGDGGAATSAHLNTPTGVAVDAAGNLYIADANNDRIRKVLTPSLPPGLPPSRLTITTASVPAAAYGISYSTGLAASGGNGARVWSLYAGALPAGITLSTAGVLSGTATAVGTYLFNVQVVAGGVTALAQFTLTVNLPPSSALSFSVQPVDTAAGATMAAVKVRALSNGVTPLQGVVVTIAIATNPGSGTLSGTLTATTDSTGTATFSTLSINNAGTGYVLAASATGFVTISSSAFNITQGAGGITTVAGGTWQLTVPANTLATNVPISTGTGTAVDSSNNIYFADTGNHMIFKITPAGIR